MTRLSPLALLLLVVIFVPSSGYAQVSGTPADLPQVVKPGDRVQVVANSGKPVQGTVTAVSASSITLDTNAGPQTFAGGAVERIVRRDASHRGKAIGLAVGLGAGLAGMIMLDTYARNEGGGSDGALLLLGGIGAGLGLGAAADAGGRQTVIYQTSKLTVRPGILYSGAAGRSRIGVAFGFAW